MRFLAGSTLWIALANSDAKLMTTISSQVPEILDVPANGMPDRGSMLVLIDAVPKSGGRGAAMSQHKNWPSIAKVGKPQLLGAAMPSTTDI